MPRALRSPSISLAALVLSAWTLFVWTTRIGNIWRDDAASTASKVGSTALALSFTVLALAVLATAVRRMWGALRPAVLALAAWTTGVWIVRSLTIVTDGDRSVGFKVVHGVLAIVSIALAAWAVRAVRAVGSAHEGSSRDLPRSAAQQRA